jgi:hypothetical protein
MKALLSNYLQAWARASGKSLRILAGAIQPFPGNCAVTAQKAAIVLKPLIVVRKKDERQHATIAV